jgi:hypothetical protein
MSPIKKDDLYRLFGCRLELIDDRNLLLLEFLKDGLVAVTMGVKGGPIAGPMMYWSLTWKGHLSVTYSHKRFPWMIEKPFLDWRSIRFEDDILAVETSTGPQVYAIEILSGTETA